MCWHGWRLLAAVAWVVVSGLGRNLVLKRMEAAGSVSAGGDDGAAGRVARGAGPHLLGMVPSIGWAAATHIGTGDEPDLVGYTIWAVFLTLGFFTLWALVNWPVSIAPMLVLLEDRSAVSALREALRLGKPFSSKLIEINLVMGIVKLALIVLAMVFSSVLIPFSEEIGAGALHLEWIVVSLLLFHCERLLPRCSAERLCRVLAGVSRRGPLTVILSLHCAAVRG